MRGQMKGLIGSGTGKWNNGWMIESVSQVRGSINELNPCSKTFFIGDELTFLLCNQKDASYIPFSFFFFFFLVREFRE